ncbi:uncharacterized protein LOC113002990 [Solenopsis invicta]|uniref:uncharacterized protein LOC113002990 n=1 Tax=Solenopsis invicta TaxID=13686 RepID=UPI00193CDF9C|nr:uncharacterized protein LOC113002990 [Solenopsis invicta]
MYLTIAAYVTNPFKLILFDIIWPSNESRFFVISIEWIIDMNKYYVPIICYNTILIMMDTIILIDVDSIHITRVVACNSFLIVRQQFKKMMLKSNMNIKISKCCECRMNAIFQSASEHVIYQEYVIYLKKFQIALELVDILNLMYRTMALISLLIGYTILNVEEIQVIIISCYLCRKEKNITINKY